MAIKIVTKRYYTGFDQQAFSFFTILQNFKKRLSGSRHNLTCYYYVFDILLHMYIKRLNWIWSKIWIACTVKMKKGGLRLNSTAIKRPCILETIFLTWLHSKNLVTDTDRVTFKIWFEFRTCYQNYFDMNESVKSKYGSQIVIEICCPLPVCPLPTLPF